MQVLMLFDNPPLLVLVSVVLRNMQIHEFQFSSAVYLIQNGINQCLCYIEVDDFS